VPVRTAGGVLDVAMPEVMRDGAGVLAVVRQFKAGGMSEHMGMAGHPQWGCLTSAGYQLSNGGVGHGAFRAVTNTEGRWQPQGDRPPEANPTGRLAAYPFPGAASLPQHARSIDTEALLVGVNLA